jgi:hypothetical protein
LEDAPRVAKGDHPGFEVEHVELTVRLRRVYNHARRLSIRLSLITHDAIAPIPERVPGIPKHPGSTLRTADLSGTSARKYVVVLLVRCIQDHVMLMESGRRGYCRGASLESTTASNGKLLG